ncbi:hypothetical protein [Sorangium sp. So ce1000]|uniref:hypothetical protein n=1 Tax=Sorangium sp. So ce1000 TaxID=3133325 RepID=UPI003F6475F0
MALVFERKRQLLGIAADEDDAGVTRWVFAPAPPEQVLALLKTRLGLRGLFESALVEIHDIDPHGTWEQSRSWSVSLDDVPEALPRRPSSARQSCSISAATACATSRGRPRTSAAHNAVLMLSGPHDETNGPFALWKWSGVPGSAPVKVQDLTAPAAAAPESIIPYGGTNDVQVLFDMGSFQIGGDDCKDVSASSQYFTDVVVHVD